MPQLVTIRQSLLRSLISIILLLSVLILGTTIWGARRSINRLSDALIDSTIEATDLKLREFFSPVDRGLMVARDWGQRGLLELDQPPEQLNQLFVPLIEQFPQISSVLVADELGQEYMLLRTADAWSIRQTRKDEWGNRTLWHIWSAPGDEPKQEWRELDYDPRTRPWFIGAVNSTDIYWTEPYRFFTTQDPGMTAALAFEGSDSVTRVIAFDVLLSTIADYTAAMEVSPNGGLVVLTDDGRLIGPPHIPRYRDAEVRRADLLKRPAELDWDLAIQAAHAFQEHHGEPGRTTFESGDKTWWGKTQPFALAADRILHIAVVIPQSDMLGSITTMRMWIVIITVAVLVLAIWRAVILARRYSTPIEALVEQSDRISRGVFQADDEIESNVAEVRQLADAHDRMREGLKSLFKLERDLQLARQIQQNTFPEQLPVVEGFDLAAWNEPADETGGDSYDIIGIQDGVDVAAQHNDKPHHKPRMDVLHADAAIMLLADATGHGIGPALSATQIRAMLRMAVRLNADLIDIAQHLNEQLTADMPESRFITAWLGQIDSAAGTLTSFSAGQGPILLYEAASQSIRRIEVDAPPFGISAEMEFTLQPPIELASGDVVAVLSDGIFEAKNAADELLGIERVQEIIAAKSDQSAVQILTAIRWALREFTGDRPHDDDQTAIVIKKT